MTLEQAAEKYCTEIGQSYGDDIHGAQRHARDCVDVFLDIQGEQENTNMIIDILVKLNYTIICHPDVPTKFTIKW